MSFVFPFFSYKLFKGNDWEKRKAIFGPYPPVSNRIYRTDLDASHLGRRSWGSAARSAVAVEMDDIIAVQDLGSKALLGRRAEHLEIGRGLHPG